MNVDSFEPNTIFCDQHSSVSESVEVEVNTPPSTSQLQTIYHSPEAINFTPQHDMTNMLQYVATTAMRNIWSKEPCAYHLKAIQTLLKMHCVG